MNTDPAAVSSMSARPGVWSRWTMLLGVIIALMLALHLIGQLDPAGGHSAEQGSPASSSVAHTDGHDHSAPQPLAADTSATASSLGALACHVLLAGCGILVAIGLTLGFARRRNNLSWIRATLPRPPTPDAPPSWPSARLATSTLLCVSRT